MAQPHCELCPWPRTALANVGLGRYAWPRTMTRSPIACFALTNGGPRRGWRQLGRSLTQLSAFRVSDRSQLATATPHNCSPPLLLRGQPSEDGGYLHSGLPGVSILGRGHTTPQMEPAARAPIAANAEARLLGFPLPSAHAGQTLSLTSGLLRGSAPQRSMHLAPARLRRRRDR